MAQRPDAGYGRWLRELSIATLVVIATALALVFFWVPLEAEQGFLQKIFYVHVPLAIVSLCGFVVGGIFAIQHLRTREQKWDFRSYVAIHMSLIFGVATLITGSIWAKGSWGHWWVWDEPTLVSFLIVFLLYATYQPLRFAIEDPERQARYASVFAITAGAFVPLNFIAVRASTAYVHPRVLGATSNLPWQMSLTFLVSLLGMTLLFTTLCKYELTAKHTRAQLRALRRLAERRAGASETTLPRRGRSAAPSLQATAMSAHPQQPAAGPGGAQRGIR
jgi:heme exporter protein C